MNFLVEKKGLALTATPIFPPGFTGPYEISLKNLEGELIGSSETSPLIVIAPVSGVYLLSVTEETQIPIPPPPIGVILTEDGENYLITEDGFNYLVFEGFTNPEIPTSVIVTEDGLNYLITEDGQNYIIKEA